MGRNWYAEQGRTYRRGARTHKIDKSGNIMKRSIFAKFGTQTDLICAVRFYFGRVEKFRPLPGQIGIENLATAISPSIFGVSTRSLVGSTRLFLVKNYTLEFRSENCVLR